MIPVPTIASASPLPADHAAAVPAVTPPSPVRAHATTPAAPTWRLRLDAALGLEVVEFRDASGALLSSIPDQRQLAAYRLGGGEAPKPQD
jgi:hypothetical protein